MLQALASILFSALALLAFGAIVQLLRNDWDLVVQALGFGRAATPITPLPPKVRAKPARSAVMLRMEPIAQRRAAA